MTVHISGGCACGAVRYETDGDIEFAFHCCCRKCQRATGGGHASAFAVNRDGLTLSGEVRQYEQVADTGAATYSGFCPTCGSPVFSRTERFPDRLYLHAATLDDPSAFKPGFVVHEDAMQSWDHFDAALVRPTR